MDPNQSRPMDPRRSPTSIGFRRGLTVLLPLVLLLAGCAPKRVVEGQVREPVRRPSPPVGVPAPQPIQKPAPQHVTGIDLPAPVPRGPSGTAPVHRSVEGLTLGVKAATLAREQLGKPYQWGATGPEKFDCSGLVWHVYGELGVQMPRVSRSQASAGRHVARSELQAGDLVFFATNGSSINHVGIYVGDSDFVHAPRRYVPVKTDSLNNSWWRQRYKGARRVR